MQLVHYVGAVLALLGCGGLVISLGVTPLTKNLDISGRFLIAFGGSIFSTAAILEGLSLTKIL